MTKSTKLYYACVAYVAKKSCSLCFESISQYLYVNKLSSLYVMYIKNNSLLILEMLLQKKKWN